MVELAPWRSPLARALHLNRSLPYARYVQLATIRKNGRPANRTVVFRGFSDEGLIQIVTDQRSDKVEHIKHQSWGEICWYFPKTREQFRFSGCLTLIDANCQDSHLTRLRHHLWQGLSDNGRSQFFWPSPGQPRADSEAFQPIPSSVEVPLENFTALLFSVTYVDHLNLKGHPQDRHVYELTNTQEWSLIEVNP